MLFNCFAMIFRAPGAWDLTKKKGILILGSLKDARF